MHQPTNSNAQAKQYNVREERLDGNYLVHTNALGPDVVQDLKDRPMSVSNEVVVQTRPIVKICLASDATIIGDGIYVDFSHRLNWRGTDFKVYANEGYHENTRDSQILSSVINSIMTPTSGISCVHVKAFRLHVRTNRTTDIEEVMKQIEYAVARAGYAVQVLPSGR